MKFALSKIVLLLLDIFAIAISIALAYELRMLADTTFAKAHSKDIFDYLSFSLLYVVVLLLFAYEGFYSRRYDFWHESRQVLKALVFSFFIVSSSWHSSYLFLKI